MEKVITEKFTGTYMDFERIGGIVLANYHDDVYISLAVAQKSVAERLVFSHSDPIALMVDGTNVKGISKEARDYYGSEEGSAQLIASAIYTRSKLSAFLANFLLKVNLHRTNIPIKLFNDKEKAIEWLKQYES